MSHSAEFFMQQALLQAELAFRAGEVPVGAVVVYNGEIIGRGYNQPISLCDPTAHAEVMALRDAALNVQNYRLPDCELYVTVEPCTMCAGALIHSRIRTVFFGTTEPKAGVAVSQAQLFAAPFVNHQVQIVGGVLREACAEIMQRFFSERRAAKQALKKAAQAANLLDKPPLSN